MKKIKITIPDNCELKQEGNTYTIVEKEKKLTYNDVARKLFNNKSGQFIDDQGLIHDAEFGYAHFNDVNNCTSRRQAEKLLAINKLMNVAKYLNGDWQPNWSDELEFKYCIYYSNQFEKLTIVSVIKVQHNAIFFKSEELAKQAIEILGEETIKLALCTDY